MKDFFNLQVFYKDCALHVNDNDNFIPFADRNAFQPVFIIARATSRM